MHVVEIWGELGFYVKLRGRSIIFKTLAADVNKRFPFTKYSSLSFNKIAGKLFSDFVSLQYKQILLGWYPIPEDIYRIVTNSNSLSATNISIEYCPQTV